MNLYQATVRVPSNLSSRMVTVWAQVHASSPIDARRLLDAQYGRGNVNGTPTLVR